MKTMQNGTAKAIGVLTLGVLALTASTASAQMPNMDMSWALRSQMQLQQQGDQNARAVAQAYYAYMQQLRMMGYRGPSLPTGVTSESLRAAIQRAQQSANAYIRGGMINSERRSNAVAGWDLRALRGCRLVVNAYGYATWVCP